jgi:hypothetical protein
MPLPPSMAGTEQQVRQKNKCHSAPGRLSPTQDVAFDDETREELIAMRMALALVLAFGMLAFLPQSAVAQLGEKKILTLAATRKMAAAAEAEAERNHLAASLRWLTTADG